MYEIHQVNPKINHTQQRYDIISYHSCCTLYWHGARLRYVSYVPVPSVGKPYLQQHEYIYSSSFVHISHVRVYSFQKCFAMLHVTWYVGWQA